MAPDRRPDGGLGQVHLVPDQQHGDVAGLFQHFAHGLVGTDVGSGPGRAQTAAVHQQQDGVGLTHLLAAQGHAHLFHALVGLAQARRIGQAHGQAVQLAAFLKEIARGAGDVRDQGAVAAQQGIEQAGLARIDGTGQYHHGALLHDLRTALAGQQAAHGGGHVLHHGGESFGSEAFHLFIGKVHGQAHLHAQLFQTPAQGRDLAAQQAVQTVEAVAQGLARRRGDEFGHGLGLAQVHAAVDEGPARELAPLRGPCPQAQGRFQDGLHDEGAAVAMDLGHVFPGESARAGHEHGQHIVQRRAFMVQGAPAVQHPGPEARELCRRGAEHAGKDLPGLRPGDADDADAPRTGSRGYGGDGRHQERSGRRRMMTTRFIGPSPELRVCTSSASCRQRCTMRR